MSVYEKHRLSDARLPFILHHYRFPAGVHACRGNWHENVELLYFTEGGAVVTSNDLRFEVEAGDLAVINQNHIHTIVATSPLSYLVAIVDRSFCLANHFDTNAVTFTPRVRDPEIAAVLTSLLSEWSEEGAVSVPLIRARLLTVMALLLDRYSECGGAEGEDPHTLAAVKRALGHLHAEYEKPQTLDALSEKVGISKYYLAREFRRLTGMTVITYLNSLRCEKSKPLLAENKMTLEGVATAVGFSGAAYFSRVFREFEGVSPSEYRAGLKR
ncbi:MAG: helix-turn-helix transcriptional regulator [Clostridia bacterium]|nr:helix-turn-helix transcriptional regulator [Clostridia bacterium]